MGIDLTWMIDDFFLYLFHVPVRSPPPPPPPPPLHYYQMDYRGSNRAYLSVYTIYRYMDGMDGSSGSPHTEREKERKRVR
jgi:hypothetical protein